MYTPHESGTSYRRRQTREMFTKEQAMGKMLIMAEAIKSHTPTGAAVIANHSSKLDRTWAVRDEEQTKRQRKRERDREIFRPILTLRQLS